MNVRGVIFDLDGTLVDSALDFDLMRAEMNLADRTPILEALATMTEDDAARCREILHRHERDGAERARLYPGVGEFLQRLHQRQVRCAVWTRNARAVAERTLARLGLEFDRIVSRECAPAKPDPAAIWEICEAWQVERGEIILIGDYLFDMQAAERAGIRGVLFTDGAEPRDCLGHELAAFCLRSFADVGELVRWMRIG
jgi:HAD superfamily hydrolase (TIGR01549 family)